MSRTAIVSAMHEELRALLPMLERPQQAEFAGRRFHLGQMCGQPVVLVLSGIGKVAAATTAALLLHEVEVERIVFTGAAGGLGAGVRVGDAVVARELLQHDMDASPLFPRFEVPLTGRSRFPTDPALSDALAAAALHCLNHAAQRIGEAHLADFGIDSPLLHEGLVISGDRFVATAPESAALREALPDALAVEMEGAALAQVCADFEARFAVVRTVSDRADDSAHVDFGRFIAEVASVYTREIIGTWLDGGAAGS
ncbi:MAG: 5'-methylthioadenosine/adenosylhomocysteine nucleosidase [Piscinibacter sp.]|nr:5'-methylthioadenosine/adenosylhomocysteine nucleosidase [Piscinibacter sp.]